MPDMAQRISAIADHIAAQLTAIATDRHHPMRIAWLATTAQDGTAQVRTIVIRDSVPQPLSVCFYTDRRSPKWQEISHHPKGSLVLFDRSAMQQIRLLGHFDRRGHEDSDIPWQTQDDHARLLYSGPRPGTPLDTVATLPANTGNGRENFGVVDLRITEIDYLAITRSGHTRALFKIAAGANWQGQLINP